jgi:hypothetical protein
MVYRALLLAGCTLLAPLALSPDEPHAGGGTGLLGLDSQAILDSQPVAFIPNLGQWDHDFAFTATTGPILTTFGSSGLLLDVLAEETDTERIGAVVGWTFEGRGGCCSERRGCAAGLPQLLPGR